MYYYVNGMKRINLTILVIIIGIAAPVLPAEGTGIDYRTPASLRELVQEALEPYLLIDVRTPFEYESGYIPTAVNIPLQDLPAGLPEVPKDSLIILYCRSGNRSASAADILKDAGFGNVVDFGGVYRWPGDLVRP